MKRPATLLWFACHELLLVWRDFISMMTAGKRSREPLVLAVLLGLAAGAHALAYLFVAPLAEAGIRPDRATLTVLTASALLSWSLMLSQAVEFVTRAFYARADLDLILASPAPARRLFAIRIGAIALSATLMAALLAGPLINVLAVIDGPRWLAAYGLLCAMGALAAALAVVVNVALFRSLGPKRTRLVSQIVAAVVGAAFIIGVQAAAILSFGKISRLDLLQSEAVLALAPAAESVLWWPARAALGDLVALLAVLGFSLGLLALVIAVFAPRFGALVIAAASGAEAAVRQRRRDAGFRPASTMAALRRKEWALLRRDPWLVSQTLMQVLYLLPPALLLWRNFGDSIGALLVVVPVLVMAAGQLAGGLAWLAVSGEDAPELVASAPISARAIILAKVQAVLGAIAVVVAPLILALALASPWLALVTAAGIAVSAASATVIQIWFRAQAKRSAFRRRQTSSRVATFAEAFSSILWAGTATLAATGTWLALFPAVITLILLLGTWAIRPREAVAA